MRRGGGLEQMREVMMNMVAQFDGRRVLCAASLACTIAGVALITPALAADLDYGPYNDQRYQERPYPYPSRGSVYPTPNGAPYGYRPYGYGAYDYRPYGYPPYDDRQREYAARPQHWADRDDGYGDEAYRYDRRYFDPDRRPYAGPPRPPAAIPGSSVDPRYAPPDDVYAEDAPPRPYGWNRPRW